ncbi:MAG: hypothetical protein NTV80_21425 [Verrucomicrobia bacterium]|nr:hypothetical protein [Verrucomicrobiota bacterium]
MAASFIGSVAGFVVLVWLSGLDETLGLLLLTREVAGVFSMRYPPKDQPIQVSASVAVVMAIIFIVG